MIHHLLSTRATVPTLGPILDFLRLLWEVDHHLRRASKQMASSMGVTGPQRLVIRIVGIFPAVTAGRLAEILHIHPSTLTGILDRLQRRRVISRRPDPGDNRRAVLGLTVKGHGYDRTRRQTIEEAVSRALSDVSADELSAARRVLNRVIRSLRDEYRL